jgi:flagellar basal-body rod protein FlgG
MAPEATMIKALYTSATGMNAQQTVIDNTANNLANVNTNGFKRSEVNFQDLIYVTSQPPGSEAAQGLQIPTGLQIGSGVRVAGNTKIFSTGNLVNTGNPLDIAINGDGFIQITLPNGDTNYTRDGALSLNSNGNLVNTSGFLISPQVTIPQEAISVSIGSDGTISVVTAGSATTSTIVGQLTLVRFPNEAGLSSQGGNLYQQTPSSGSPIIATPGLNGTGLLQQGFLETSNVDVVSEMVNLILAQRAYEFNTRAIKTADDMLSNTTAITR